MQEPPHLIIKGTVCRLLRGGVLLLLAHRHVHGRVDVHSHQLLCLHHIDVHLGGQQEPS